MEVVPSNKNIRVYCLVIHDVSLTIQENNVNRILSRNDYKTVSRTLLPTCDLVNRKASNKTHYLHDDFQKCALMHQGMPLT